jgi:hypothetical protein
VDGHPLWSQRDRDAEAIRTVLRCAGHRSWRADDTDVGSSRFVVESQDPFVVEKALAAVLTTAGYGMQTAQDGRGGVAGDPRHRQ